VKFTTSIKVDNQGTINERIILNFEEENFNVIVSWDRIIIKGQGNIKLFTHDNSVMESVFFDILNKIETIDEFDKISNVLLVVTYLHEKKHDDSGLIKYFEENYISKKATSLLDECNDLALTVEENLENSNTSVSFGPYYGPLELVQRPLSPINPNNLDDFKFEGIMVEYKKMKRVKEFSFSDFVSMQKESYKVFEDLCKK
jgi:hypothetical protein